MLRILFLVERLERVTVFWSTDSSQHRKGCPASMEGIDMFECGHIYYQTFPVVRLDWNQDAVQ